MAYYSNSSEGDLFDEQCTECIHADEEAMCPVAYIQATYNYDQHGKGQEKLKEIMDILVDNKKGCMVKPWIDKLRGKVKPKCLKKKLVFGDDEQIEAIRQLELLGVKA